MAVSREVFQPQDDENITELDQHHLSPSTLFSFFMHATTAVSIYASLCSGFSDGAEMLRGIYEDKYRNIAFLGFASIANGSITAGMTAPTTKESFEELFTLISQGGFPEDWKALPSNIYYQFINSMKKILLTLHPEMNPEFSTMKLLEEAQVRGMNDSLRELLHKLLNLCEIWEGGNGNFACYRALESAGKDDTYLEEISRDPSEDRINFFKVVAEDIAVLKEDYDLRDIQAVLDAIKRFEAWPEKKKLLSFFLVLPFALLAAGFDTCSSYFNIQYAHKEIDWMKKWSPNVFKIIGGIISVGVALTSVATEGKETFLGVARLFNKRDEVQYSSDFSKYAGPTISYALALANALVETSGDHMSARDIFGLSRKSHLIGLGTVAAISNIPSIFFIASYTFDIINDLCGYIKQLVHHRHEMSKLGIAKDVFSASLAFALSAYLSELSRLNIKIGLDELMKDMNIKNHASDQASTSIMWIMCAYYSVLGAAAIYSPLRSLVGWTTNKVVNSKVLSNCVSTLFSGESNAADVEASQGLLQDEDEDDLDRAPVSKSRCKGACTIL